MFKMFYGLGSFALFLYLFSAPIAFGNTAKCTEALRDADLLVRDVRLGCETVKQCLVRRDTCVLSGIPNTQTKCEAVDECMGQRDADFADSAQCRYQWSKTGEVFKCNLKRKMFAAQERCPGRTLTGMSVAIIFLSGPVSRFAIDSGFNCEAVNNHLLSRSESLESARQRIRKFCPQGAQKAQDFPTPICAESQTFDTRSNGQYALPEGGVNARNVNDGRDGSGSGNEGGGEESGGGGGPKSKAR